MVYGHSFDGWSEVVESIHAVKAAWSGVGWCLELP